jgi:hypothetical protein
MPLYAGPPPPSGTVQLMFCVGSLMSHALQCRQFCALMTKFFSPLSFSKRHLQPTPPPPYLNILVHSRRAKSPLGPVIRRQVDFVWHRRVDQLQMRRLVSLVVRPAASQIREEVKRQLPVGLGVLDGLALRRWLRLRMVRAAMRQRPRRLPPQDVSVSEGG